MKTSTRHSWVAVAESGRQTSNFTWGWGIHRSSVSQIIYKVLLLRCYKKRGAQQLTESHSMHALFSVYSLRDNNAIRSKRTWKPNHADSILEPSEYFYQISSISIDIISSYTVAKLGRFFETQCSKGKGKGRALDIAPQVDIATTKALRYMARTKQRRTYLPYTSPAVAGTHLPTQRGWRVEYR